MVSELGNLMALNCAGPDMDDQRLHELIGGIYGSSVSPDRWPATLTEFAVAFNGNGVGLSHKDYRNSQFSVSFQRGFSDEQVHDYLENYAAIDPRWAYGQSLRTGATTVDQMHITEDEMDRDPFYAQFLAPADMRYYLAGVVENSAYRATGFTIQRSRSAGPMTPLEQRHLGVLIPHLQRALALQQQVAHLRASELVLTDLLDRVSGAAIVLNASGKPVFINEAGQSLITAEDGLACRSDALLACRRLENDVLQATVAAAISVSSGSALDPGPAVRISRPSGKPPLVVWALPIVATMGIYRGGPYVLLLIRDPGCARIPVNKDLRALYSLTHTETLVLEGLVNGASAEEISCHLGMSLPTVRKHIRALFEKTDVHRQIDLVRLVFSLQRI